MIQKSGLQNVLDFLEVDLTRIAVGTGAAPEYLSTQLTSEVFRNSPSDSFFDGLTLVKELFLDESQANVTITEIGILGDGATGTAGSGALFASAGAAIQKTDTQSLTVSFEISIQEVPQ